MTLSLYGSMRASCLLLAAPLCAQGPLVWSEEFNSGSAPDPTIWNYDLGDGSNGPGAGWGNQELQVYTDQSQNVRVENGHLVITALPTASGGFTSGRIKTQDKLTFQYGTLEARIQVPDVGDGLWPAFWTLGNNISTVTWPACGEIDVMEMGAAAGIQAGTQNRLVGSNVFWDANGNANFPNYLTVAQDLNTDFHIWRLEWTPTLIRTFIDNQQVMAFDISGAAASNLEEFHAPHFVLLNLAVGGWYPGILNASGITAPLPAEYRVDYLRLYDNGHTILGGTGAPASASTYGRGCPATQLLQIEAELPAFAGGGATVSSNGNALSLPGPGSYGVYPQVTLPGGGDYIVEMSCSSAAGSEIRFEQAGGLPLYGVLPVAPSLNPQTTSAVLTLPASITPALAINPGAVSGALVDWIRISDPATGLVLSAIGGPEIGGSWTLTADNLEPNTAACAFWFGDQQLAAGFSLAPLGGDGCFAYSNANLAAALAPVTVSSSAFTLPIPNAPNLHGFELSVQSSAPSSALPMGFMTSNGLLGRVGF
ncbi:MAG: glycoside hydrolase family 16 protein [Planctomycetota bacterium]|nr:glycoside hydrolase family 16 protein [Planctomycetota bacterium]